MPNLSNKKCIHLGCGKRYLPGWIHVDLADFSHIDYRQDISDLSNFEDGFADEIYACHLLEHFPRKEVVNVLAEWSRVIKPGGIIHIAVPDFEACVAHYSENGNLADIASFFVGGQKNEYDFHYYVYDFNLLKKLLENVGFIDIKRYDWKDFLPGGFDDYSRAYLPHMDFEHGRLMSLNVSAVKGNNVVSADENDEKITMGITQR